MFFQPVDRLGQDDSPQTGELEGDGDQNQEEVDEVGVERRDSSQRGAFSHDGGEEEPGDEGDSFDVLRDPPLPLDMARLFVELQLPGIHQLPGEHDRDR